MRLTPRAVRVRNRCIASLAATRALPVPTDDDLSDVGDDVGLEDAFRSYERRHTPPAWIAEIPERAPTAAAAPRRSKRRLALTVSGALLLVSGVPLVVWTQWPRPVPAAVIWTPLTDSASVSLRRKLLMLESSRTDSLELSAPELAALLLTSQRRPVLHDMEVRADSALWIRGRLSDSARVELRVEAPPLESRIAALRVAHVVVDGDSLLPGGAAVLVRRIMPRAVVRESNLLVVLPRGLAFVRLRDGAAWIFRRG